VCVVWRPVGGTGVKIKSSASDAHNDRSEVGLPVCRLTRPHHSRLILNSLNGTPEHEQESRRVGDLTLPMALFEVIFRRGDGDKSQGKKELYTYKHFEISLRTLHRQLEAGAYTQGEIKQGGIFASQNPNLAPFPGFVCL
jgi:hypothetical protein